VKNSLVNNINARKKMYIEQQKKSIIYKERYKDMGNNRGRDKEN
jgi:hypothetical protein